MKKTELALESLKLLWRRKYLWLFGLFVAGGVGGGAGGPRGPGADGDGGLSRAQGLPEWFWPVVIAGLLVGLVALVLHVASEAALIQGVRAEREGEAYGIRRGFHVGFSHFWRLLGLKLVFAFVLQASALVILTPVLLGVFKVIPLAPGVGLTLLLALVGIPWLLTVYFIYEYAMRFLVLEDRSVKEAARAAYRYLHGRIVDSLQVLIVAFIGRMGAGLVGLLVVAPIALLAVGVYFAAGLWPALAFGLALGAPLMLAVAGAGGVFTSSVWTIEFLEERRQAA